MRKPQLKQFPRENCNHEGIFPLILIFNFSQQHQNKMDMLDKAIKKPVSSLWKLTRPSYMQCFFLIPRQVFTSLLIAFIQFTYSFCRAQSSGHFSSMVNQWIPLTKIIIKIFYWCKPCCCCWKVRNGISKSAFREAQLQHDFVKEGPKVIYPR